MQWTNCTTCGKIHAPPCRFANELKPPNNQNESNNNLSELLDLKLQLKELHEKIQSTEAARLAYAPEIKAVNKINSDGFLNHFINPHESDDESGPE